MIAGLDRVCAEGTAKEIEEFGPLGRRIGVPQDVLQQARALHDGAWVRVAGSKDSVVTFHQSGPVPRTTLPSRAHCRVRCWLRAVVDDKRNDNRCIVDRH